MAMPPLRDIINDTAADATDVEFNFNTIEQHIRSELIDRTGAVSMTGPLTLAGPPVNPLEAVPKSYVDAIFPVASMLHWPVATVPSPMDQQWKICDGQILNVSEYPTLYARIANTFNKPSDSFGGTQFRLPDMRRRIAVGYDALVDPFDAIGFDDTLGAADAFLPAHVHPMPHTHPQAQHQHSIGHGHTVTVGNDSPDHGHTLTQSNFVKAEGTGDAKLYSQTNNPGISGYGPYNTGGGVTGGAGARHSHSVTVTDAPASVLSGLSPTVATGAESTPNTSSTGDGASVTNRNYPPFLILNMIIKVK